MRMNQVNSPLKNLSIPIQKKMASYPWTNELSKKLEPLQPQGGGIHIVGENLSW